MAQAVVQDKGDALLITVGYDFTGFTLIEVFFTKPDGTEVTKTSTSDGVTDNGDATLGVVKYTIEDALIGALDDGTWKVSVRMTDSVGLFSGVTPASYIVKRRNQTV